MDSSITAAAIAAAVSAVGWLVTHILSERAERSRAKRQARLTHIERQLEELYGPLFFLVLEGRTSFRSFCETAGRDFMPQGGTIDGAQLTTWLFWVDHDLMPRNRAIQNLLAGKAHLIDAARMPDSYAAFLVHHNSWQVHHLRWKEQRVEYTWTSRTPWPEEFAQDVIATFEDLKQRQAELTGLLADS